MSDDQAVETAVKIRGEIEHMLDVAREVETEVRANPGSSEVSRTDRIEISARREQLEDVHEMIVEVEQVLRS